MKAFEIVQEAAHRRELRMARLISENPDPTGGTAWWLEKEIKDLDAAIKELRDIESFLFRNNL